MNVRNVFCNVLFAVLGMLALTVGQTAKADELTVYDGTTATQYVPMFVYCFDDFTRSQFIIPADSLAEMSGGTITSIKYYTTSSNIPYTTASEFDIYMTEVSETTLSAYVDKANKVLGWKADTPTDQVLASAWKWQETLWPRTYYRLSLFPTHDIRKMLENRDSAMRCRF